MIRNAITTGQLVNTTPNPRIRRTPRTRDFFSRDSRLESSSQEESLCPAKQSFSHLAQHVVRVLVVVSVSLEHWHFFPLALLSDVLSDLLPDIRCCPFHTEIYLARIRRMCLSAAWSKRTRLHSSHQRAVPLFFVSALRAALGTKPIQEAVRLFRQLMGPQGFCPQESGEHAKVDISFRMFCQTSRLRGVKCSYRSQRCSLEATGWHARNYQQTGA